jgi:ribosomal protein S18 acetylase RimI-like enzyme
MSELRRVGSDDWELYQEIRLRALSDSPDAFGSTLERERGFTEDEWRTRLTGAVYVVLDPDAVSVGGLFDDAGTARVWGMWTDPAHRGRGHARAILDTLLPAGASAELHVNIANAVGRRVYERFGFVGTGELEPLRPGSEQQMERMVLRRGLPR